MDYVRSEKLSELTRRIETSLNAVPQAPLDRETADLKALFPPNSRARVTLARPEGDHEFRKIREDASVEKYWKAEDEVLVVIRFDPIVADNTERLRELLTELDEVEAGMRFVSLTWFRDKHLPKTALSWAANQHVVGDLLHLATDEDLVQTQKIHNPKTPAYPTTTLSINRSNPKVFELLGRQKRQHRFNPRPIGGEPLSKSIIEARR